MPDVIESAKSGRAKCRGCRAGIAKGELRFGECAANPYGEGDTLQWFHLACAADKRSDKLLAALTDFDGDPIDGRAELEEIAAAGQRNPNLARVQHAERAPSGRARCRECRELIEKGVLRLVMEPEAEVQSNMFPAYFVHAGCAEAHVGLEGLLDKVHRVSPALEEPDLAELAGMW